MNTVLLVVGIVLAAAGALWNAAEIFLSRSRIRKRTDEALGEMVRQKKVTREGVKELTERIAEAESEHAALPAIPMLAGLLCIILSLLS